MRKVSGKCLPAFAFLALAPASALAQRADVPNMQAIASALGVECTYCHGSPRGGQMQLPPPPPQAPQPGADLRPPSRIDIARAMIAMTRDLNAKIVAATGKMPGQVTQVTCATCHRGIAIPGLLSDIVAKAALEQGPDAAIAEYRDLRQRFYGAAVYDFREDSLIDAAQKVMRAKPRQAIPILQLNLEFFPKSVRTYGQIAFAYTRELDDESAMAALRKALEIEPDNGQLRGQLEQLESYHRKPAAKQQ